MSQPEQAAAPGLQSLSGFATTSPFSQPPKATNPTTTQPPPMPGSNMGGYQQPQAQAGHTHERLPGPAALVGGTGSPLFNGMRRGSGHPEKTAVGRSGVFEGGYEAGDGFYRRHSVDMGVGIGGAKAPIGAYSPPHGRYPAQGLSGQLSQLRMGASRSGAASPHPLSYDQTAGGLSPSTPTSPGSSQTTRGAKRGHQSDESDGDEPGRDGSAKGASTDKPYACDQCELTFSRQHNLKSHALTHSTERPFQCPICQTPFRRQHDLKRHMKLHTGEKPHTCTNCGRSFARLDALNRHMRAENFHACSQAAKRARTAGMPKPEDLPRLKGGSVMLMVEQRRASTTSQPQGAPQAWTHWTSRPSIAADEAMIRRMQERFGSGAPPPPPPPPPSSAQQQVSPAGPPLGGPPAQYPPQPQKLPHSMATFSMQPRQSYDSRAYAATSQQQQQQQPGPSQYAPGASRLAPPAPPAMAGNSPPQPLRPGASNAHGLEVSPWKQRQQPSSNSLGISNGAAPNHHLPPPSALRLPPMDLGPPRRHSLAVTSHLDRYRARDASPPPSDASTNGNPNPAAQKPGPRLPPPQGYTQHPPPQQYLAAPTAAPPVYSTPQSTSPPQSRPQPPPPPPANKSGPLPLRPTLPHLVDSGELATLPVRVPDNHDLGDSRRGSVYSTEHVPETRRSSIIALTNHMPESIGELRAENAELRRRIDDMESRHMKEVDQLKAVVRELRIEKSLLKSLLMEKGETMTSPQMQSSSASSPRQSAA